jgi:UDP-3-O-[3-hydroxymyristoyl] glucosamine N-acyltransferase
VNITVRRLAEIVQGAVRGDGDVVIHSARPLKEANPGDITFAESEKHWPSLLESRASAAIVPPSTPLAGKALIDVADPLMAFVKVYQHLQGVEANKPSGIDPRAAVHASAKIGADPSIHEFVSVAEGTIIGKRCRLHAGVVIGKNCCIGDDVVLYPNVVLYDGVVIDDRVVIHANSVIGADGFGFRFHEGRHVKVPQLSYVIIGSDVEIGACATIDRGAFEPTRIGAGTKIDNQVQVAHNCQIGEHNLLAALVGIGGSSTTGNYVTMAGQVGVADHVKIGDGVIIAAQSGITNTVAPGECMMGMPARPIRTQRRIHAVEEKLPEMRRDLTRIKKHLGLTDAEK